MCDKQTDRENGYTGQKTINIVTDMDMDKDIHI